MSIKTQIDRLNLSKSKIRNAIIEKGVVVQDSVKIDTFDLFIEKIPTGADNICTLRIDSNIGIKPIIYYSAFESYSIVSKIADYRQTEKTLIQLENVIGTAPVVIFYASPAFSFPSSYNLHKYSVKLKNISVSNGIKTYEWITAAHLSVELNATKESVQNISLQYE